MSAYSQVKRQKVREVRPGENVDYFQGLDKVEYSSMAGAGALGAFRHYGGERVHARAPDDWLKYSVSLADFRNTGSEVHLRSPHRPWDDGSNTVENYKRCIKALFDFCGKLGIKYWTAFDSDLVPSGDSWDEGRQHWDEVLEYVQELAQRTHLKLLWIAPDLRSHPRYANGALTSTEASTFAAAACQVKRCVEAAARLAAESVLLAPWEPVAPLADAAREVKLFAKLLKITAEYKDRLNYRCQLLLMPYPWQSGRRSDDAAARSYVWDVTSCLHLLRSHSLERHYRVCTPPGHHALMATVYSMLGGVMITNDEDLHDSRTLTLTMKYILDQGSPPPGGWCAAARGGACEARALAARHVRRADALAAALRRAAALLADQTFSKHAQQRYASYYSGFGSRLVSADVTMEECEDYFKKNQSQHGESSRVESEELMLQRLLDSAEHM